MNGLVFKAIRKYNKIKPAMVEKLFGIEANWMYIIERNNEIPDSYVRILSDYLKIPLYDNDFLKEYLKDIPERYKVVREKKRYF